LEVAAVRRFQRGEVTWVQALRVIGCSRHARCRGRDQHGLSNAHGPGVAAEMADDFGAAERVADQDQVVVELEPFDDGAQVRGQRVDVVSAIRRLRAPMPAPIEHHDARAALEEVREIVAPDLVGHPRTGHEQ
jgi:hypothetical protein